LESIRECAEAEKIISEPLHKIAPLVDHSLSNVSSLFDREKASAAIRVFRYISEYLNALRTLGIASMLNINLSDYLKFRTIIPNVIKMESGDIHVMHKRTQYSESDADFCLKYIVNYALIVQDQFSKRT